MRNRKFKRIHGCRWSKATLSAVLALPALFLTVGSAQEAGEEVIPDVQVVPPAEEAARPTESLHQFERLNGSIVTGVFAGAIDDQIHSIVPIETTNGKLVALSVAAFSNGYLVSKASELEGVETDRLVARVPKLGLIPARMVQMQKENDLALLKVDAKVVPIEWAVSTVLKTGFLVGAVANARGAVRVGIVSASPRSIDREGGVIGVLLDSRRGVEKNGGALVTQVFEGSGASQAGIKSGDIILLVAGKMVQSPEDVTEIVTTFDVGESVEIVIERRINGEVTKRAIDVDLGYRREVLENLDRNQVLSGASSNRSAGFENVIQHDIPLGPEAMGGVLFTIEGKAVGMNIARRDRVTTYALPSEVVQRVARDMLAVELGAGSARGHAEAPPKEMQRPD